MPAPEATAKNAEAKARKIAAAADRERDRAIAAFLLSTADQLGVKVGTNGHELATVSTRGAPFDLVWELERALAQNIDAVIDHILCEAARRGVAP